jgi:hypothetical protein
MKKKKKKNSNTFFYVQKDAKELKKRVTLMHYVNIIFVLTIATILMLLFYMVL